jgi:AraC family transcriptional regulator
MEKTHLFIKNMVCNRCIKVVKEELEAMNLKILELKLGEVVLENSVDSIDFNTLKSRLQENGFELLDDKKAKTIEKIKNTVIEIVHQEEAQTANLNFSDIISTRVEMDYNYLSNLFSSLEAMTIERYIILQRIERVKELLVYNELTLSEIAWKTGYSSVQHLSSQFKKITGFTPSHFKKIKDEKRRGLDEVK